MFLKQIHICVSNLIQELLCGLKLVLLLLFLLNIHGFDSLFVFLGAVSWSCNFCKYI